jgi:hypothetical protein
MEAGLGHAEERPKQVIMRRTTKLVVGAFLVTATVAATLVAPALPLGWAPNEARAVIGRPLTPISYAGVARRTVRRM